MSDSREKQSATNGTSSSVTDPLQRLSSFKTPRDLSLGGAKPSKKVFTPNLNISRNKKGPNLPTVTRDKSHDKGKKDRKSDRNRNIKNGPNIIKSSGVFSEGVAASEIRSSRAYVGGSRDSDAAPVLQKPFIRVKDVYKIDKELEEQKIRSALGAAAEEASDEEAPDALADSDAPVRLPLSDGVPSVEEKKAIPDVKKDVSEETDIVSLLRSDKPTLIMLQFPDTLPGRAAAPEDDAPKRRDNSQPSSSTEPATEDSEEKPDPDRCRLADLQEGRMGKLLIHRSGRVEIQLGDTMFDVAAGTPCSFRQEAVSVAVDEDSRSANLVSLGALPHKLNILPNWEALLADMALY
ncbi:DNA-directed RNA polymerase III subunit RPC4 isoform X2 [Plutella xylostella]|uniref:DNA-directed RNA polymerase III subunit RPC4 isoform X2 n=1 Tax=Plutella xylostella TaxID=51655 RepID=UPI002032CF1F|nr:DNA-directed RNA polymerase III subunit RPC4 isoform X2 [Plutella xylostella]